MPGHDGMDRQSRHPKKCKSAVGLVPARSSSGGTCRKEPAMAKLIFVNLPVSDLARATAFYQAVGAEKNEQFCDGTASCMVFSETIHAMLLTHDKFRQFTPRKIADAKTSNRGADLHLRRQPRRRR